ncbi:ABC transporter ATP-binding protein [Psychrobacillus sp. MER TA 171]|nr:ABC transporter ATP-binding protein [Psychrobacillus sp. MER TA 171]
MRTLEDVRNEECEMIELRDVRKKYRSGTKQMEVLRGMDLRVEQGEYVAIMGKSGSGKSTMLNLLGTLDLLDKGSYVLAGKSVHKMGKARRAKLRNEEIGFVFQHFQLIPNLSVYQNVLLPLTYGRKRLKRKKARVLAMLEEMGILDKKNYKPDQLSGGEKQRVAIARALVNEPSLILADEPTGSLDEETTKSILNLFDRVHEKGATLIIITHDMEVASRAQRILTLQNGVLI